MSLSPRLRKLATVALVAALGAVLAEAQQTPPTPPAGPRPPGLAGAPAAVVAAHKHLLAYDTGAARQALEGSPADTNAWVATATCRILGLEKELEAAVAECRRAADLDRSHPAPALFLGDSLAYAEQRGAAAGAYAQAETRARAILAAQADDPSALYYLGVAQQRQQRFAEAATTLESLRSARPEDAEVLFQLGTTRFYQEEWQPAFDLLSAALERKPGIALAYYYRGLAAAKLNRKDVLFNDLDRFVKMAPEAPEAANARQILSSF